MRRAKSGPALFEVLSREQDAASGVLKTPDWWSPGGAQQKVPIPLRRPGVERLDDERSRRDDSRAVEDDPVPFLQLVGSQVRVTFTSVTAAAAVFATMLVVLGGYELGRRSGDAGGFRRGYDAGRAAYAADELDEIQLARAQEPETRLVRDLLAEPAHGEAVGAPGGTDTRAPQAQRAEWIRGYTYIVAQEFASGRREDALRAHAYLSQHGIETALVGMPNGGIQLITKQGYDRSDPQQRESAQRLLEMEHNIGSQFFASGGGYRLKGYFKTLAGDAW
ncbi:MAG: hypothetical protein ACE5HE_13075 [Phycisphaerae bacterium]